MTKTDLITRRAVLCGLGAVSLAVAVEPLRAQGARMELTVHPEDVLATVPTDYIGLSYESAQLVHPDYFAAGNRELTALFRTLGRHGVLRIGGNTSAYTAWQPNAPAAPGKGKDAAAYGPDLGARVENQQPSAYVLTPHAIDNLRGFLDATGWGLIYGLNLRFGTPESAADEAAYVQNVCGPKLLGLQFGNEPDLFNHELGSEAEATRWTYDEFLQKWKAMYAAVHARLPQTPIAGPDCAFNAAWVERFGKDTRGQAAFLTTHYYAEGPPKDPRMTIDFLLHGGTKLKEDVYDAMDAAKTAGLPFRMSEGNSCYNGGKPGVSDTLASALWAGDFLLDLAARGASGVNLHGGGRGVYTPIAADADGGSTARPDYYGMWLAAQFAGGRMMRTEWATPSENVTAYAASSSGETLLAVFNKGNTPLPVAVRGLPATGKAKAFQLTGPSLASTTAIKFGEGGRKPGSVWKLDPDGSEPLAGFIMAGGSAVLLRVG